MRWKDGITLVTSVCSCQDIFVEWVICATNCMPINASYIIYLNTKSWYFRRFKKTREQAVKHSKGNGAETLRKRKEDLEQKIFITYSSTPGFQFQSSAEVEAPVAPVAIEDELQPDSADEDTTEKHGEDEQPYPSRVDSTDHVPDTTAVPVPADVSTNQVNILILLQERDFEQAGHLTAIACRNSYLIAGTVHFSDRGVCSNYFTSALLNFGNYFGYKNKYEGISAISNCKT